MKLKLFIKKNLKVILLLLGIIIGYLLYTNKIQNFIVGGQEGITNYEILHYDSLDECRSDCQNVLTEISSMFVNNARIYDTLSRPSKNPFIASCKSNCNRGNTINKNTMLNDICTNNSFILDGINETNSDICHERR
mgnify:CR=1 FL=1|tara:strand:- start:5640 stop:6047 length:408 start_codon:yes stop_codon:yes gene_type:complete